ncbi:MAG: InlB B-repeat-containing protein, partial [Clostridiales bacterium]|nr:InlB B-repeat-containing protein [Clostridiales bacterium]
MKKMFIPLFLVFLMALSCYAVASAEENGGIYTMLDKVIVDEYGNASFDIILTPSDAIPYAGFHFYSRPGDKDLIIDFVSFDRPSGSGITWYQPSPSIPDNGIINFGITSSGLNALVGTITCKVEIKYTGDIPTDISFYKEGIINDPNREKIERIFLIIDDTGTHTISLPMTGPDKITILPYMWNRHTVTFYSNDGSAVVSQTVEDKGQAEKPKDPTKTGFDFAGWYDNAALSGSAYNFDTPITDDLDLYAKWIPIYTVTYKVVNGSWTDGATADKTEKVIYNGFPAEVPTDMIANTGHGSGSWSSDPVDAAITADTTFTFTFIANTYTVTYKVANGTWADGTSADKTETVIYNGFPANVPSGMVADTGHGPGSWSSNPAETVIIGNTTFTYTFTLKTYTVTFYPNNGNEKTVEPVNHGSPVAKPADPIREGYEFADWYTDEDCKEVYDFKTTVTSDLDLYANWVKTYKVTFDCDDGTPEPGEQIKHWGEKATEPAAMTKSGFKFGGWYDNNKFEGAPYSFDTPVTANIELYAKWIDASIVTYIVTFIPNGGIPEPAEQVIEEGKKAIQPAIVKTGYTVDSWYTNAALTGAPYNFDELVTGDLHLYAKWQINIYTVTFNSDEGSVVAEQKISHGSKVNKPVDPT